MLNNRTQKLIKLFVPEQRVARVFIFACVFTSTCYCLYCIRLCFCIRLLLPVLYSPVFLHPPLTACIVFVCVSASASYCLYCIRLCFCIRLLLPVLYSTVFLHMCFGFVLSVCICIRVVYNIYIAVQKLCSEYKVWGSVSADFKDLPY